MNVQKYAGILRCTMNGYPFETSKGFNKTTGEALISCVIRLKKRLSRSMTNMLANKFDLVDKKKWAEVVKMSGAGSYVNDWGENGDIKEMLFDYILNHATWNMGNDGVMEAVLAF